jgi:hypothetical protein
MQRPQPRGPECTYVPAASITMHRACELQVSASGALDSRWPYGTAIPPERRGLTKKATRRQDRGADSILNFEGLDSEVLEAGECGSLGSNARSAMDEG